MAHDERTARVHAAQLARGMRPRDDSQLTKQYAHGVVDDLDGVVDELIAVEFIHRRTPYGDVKERVFRVLADRLHAQWPAIPWKDLWDIVRFYAPALLKLELLARADARIPHALDPSD